MPLPILHNYVDASPENLVRLYHRAVLHFVRHLGEEAALDAGTAFTNPQLAEVDDANCLLDATVPQGSSVADVMREVEAHFGAAGVACRAIVPNPSAPPERTDPLVDHLLASGWHRCAADILHYAGAPTSAPSAPPADPRPTVIPARASFRHARSLAEEAAAEADQPQLADALLAHLDDAHWDALLALRDGRAVASVGVLAVGELGAIDELYVSPAARRQGLGSVMLGRAMEICARSLFRHVMLSVAPGNIAAAAFYARRGFRPVGHVVSYRRG